MVDVPRFDLRLHKTVHLAVDLPAQDAQIPDLVLDDHRLLRDHPAAHQLLHPHDTEKALVPVLYVSSGLVVVPRLRILQPVLPDGYMHRPVPLSDPCLQLFCCM